MDKSNFDSILENHLDYLSGLIFHKMRIDLFSLIKRKQALYAGPQYQYVYRDWVLTEDFTLSVTTVDVEKP